MARPALAASARRDCIIGIRLPQGGKAALKRRARSARRSTAAHMRHLLICGPVEIVWHEALALPVYQELRAIGINLRQLSELPAEVAVREAIRVSHKRLSALLAIGLGASRALPEDDEEDAVPSPAPQSFPEPCFLRTTRDEREVIAALAARAGLTLSDYAREMLTSEKIIAHRPREIEGPSPERLHAFGVDFNAFTHQANIDRFARGEVLPLLRALDALLGAFERED
ncbi:MAG: hypothetical protein EOM21_21110 [Gammaproteobacteria bacterium]|nr:hypothetical protein [Gammaproteobacteria bacterium]